MTDQARTPGRVLRRLLAALVLLALPAAAYAQVSVQIKAGTAVDAGEARLLVSGDWETGGTFEPGNSTVVFNGTGPQQITGSARFNGLSVDKPSGSLSLAGPTQVDRVLELSQGTLDNGSAQVSLGDGVTIRRKAGSLKAAPAFGASVNLEYTGTTPVETGAEVPTGGTTAIGDFVVGNTGGVTLTTSVTVTGTLQLDAGTLDNGTNEVVVAEGGTVADGGGELETTPTYQGPVALTYSGSSPVTVGNKVPDVVDRLTVDGPGGVLLGKSLTVTDRLEVLDGSFDLNGQDLTLGADAVLVETPGHTVTGTSGVIKSTRVLNAPDGTDVAGLGVTITSAADLGSTEIRRGHAVQTAGGHTSIRRYFDILPTNSGNLDATLAFSYDASELDGAEESQLTLFRSADGGATWMPAGGTLDPEANTVTLGGIDRFSRWTVVSAPPRVPVEIAGLEAVDQGEGVLLRWQTPNETDNAGFEVQRQEGDAWQAVGFVEGHGTTAEAQNYSFDAGAFEPGHYAFRLKQVYLDGVFTFSPEIEVTVEVPGNYVFSEVYPNPFHSQGQFTIAVAEQQNVRVEVYNLLGRRVAVLHDGPLPAHETHHFTFEANGLSNSVYLLRAAGETFSATRTMTLAR